MSEFNFRCSACGMEFPACPNAILETYDGNNNEIPSGAMIICLDCQDEMFKLNEDDEGLH